MSNRGKFLFDEKLMQIARDHEFAIIFDYDGTLMETNVTDYKKFYMNPIRFMLLREIFYKYKFVGLITGRSKSYFDKMEVDLFIAGNFGLDLEDSSVLSKYIPIIKNIKNFLLKNHKDEIEFIDDKEYSLAVHFYNPTVVMEKIQDAVDSKYDEIMFMKGNEVLEIRPPIPMDKGTTIEKIIKDNNLRKVLYIGDDLPDILAFEKLRELKSKNILDEGVSLCIYNEIIESKNVVDFFLNDVKELYILMAIIRWW